MNGTVSPLYVTTSGSSTDFSNGEGGLWRASKGSSSTGRGISQFFGVVNKSFSLAQKVGAVAGLAAIALAPFYLFKAAKSIKSFCTKKIDKRLDHALHVATNLRRVGEATGAFILALEKVKAVATNSFAWFPPFSAVMSVFSIASIVTNVRSYIQTRRVIKEIETLQKKGIASGENSLQTYRHILNYLDQKQRVDVEFISTMFNVGSMKFVDALAATEADVVDKLSSKEESQRKEGETTIRNTLEALKGRLKAKNFSSILSITASVIAILASTILLASSSFSAGLSVMGVSGVVSLACWMQHKAAEYKFANDIHLKRTPLEWVIC